MGWNVIRIWEHDLEKQAAKCIGKIRSVLNLRKSCTVQHHPMLPS
jgi:very-short-patch-repair endonuclease